MTRSDLRKKIAAFMGANRDRLIKRNEILKRLSIKNEADRVRARKILKEMVAEGSLSRQGSRLSKTREPGDRLISGKLKGHRHGFGFVIPEDETLDDIYIHRENMSTALDGDKVLVEPMRTYGRYRGKGPEGKIVKVLSRFNSKIVGTLQKTGSFYYVVPDNPALFQDSHNLYYCTVSLPGQPFIAVVFPRVSLFPP